MKKVVVTGSYGFVGKNLMTHLNRMEGLEVVSIVRETRVADFPDLLRDADIIFHLAGVNRPKDPAEFVSGNTDLTAQLLTALGQVAPAKIPTFVISSSTQAETDNSYGKSKREAEKLVAAAAEKGLIQGVIYRLPGVFGKWSKPNYNSVISTFCHNVAHGLPLEVREPSYTFPVVYIDDVVAEFLVWLNQPEAVKGKLQEVKVRTQFEVSLRFLADTIQSFPKSRESLIAPRMGDTLTKYLYSTYLSYLPQDKFSYPMELKVDNRGDLFEWIKSKDFGQIFISTTKPGITRGNHYHHTKTEKFLVIRGEAVIRFRKVGNDKVIEYPVSGREPTVVDIPTGYTHNITNVGNSELITLFWANEILDQDNPDTYFLEV